MAFDILQGVQYDPRQDDRATQLLLSGLAEGNKQYEAVRTGLEEALGQYGTEASLYARDPDKPFLQQKLADITTNLPKLVQDKYAGDYGAARFDIARQLAKEKQYFDLAKSAYEREKQYEPIYTKLALEKKLINPQGIDPRQQSIFDDSGKYLGTPQYNPLERSDYDKLIHEGLVQGIDKLSKEGKLHPSSVPGFLETVTKRGLDAIPDGELKQRIKDYTKQFLSESTFMEDPEMAPYKDDPTRFLASRVKALAGAGTSTQYMDDWLMREQMREARKKSTTGLQTPFSGRFVVDPSKSVEDVKSTFSSLRGESSAPDKIKNSIQAQRNLISKVEQERENYRQWVKDNPDAPHMNPDDFGKDNIGMSNIIIRQLEGELSKYGKDKPTPLNELKKTYSRLWQASGQDTNKFLGAVEQIETDRAKSKYLLMQHSDTEAQDVFTNSIKDAYSKATKSEKNFNLLDRSLNTSKQVSGEKFGDVVTTEIDPYNGRIIMYNKNGEAAEMNPNLINEGTEHYLGLSKKVIQNQYDMKDDSFKPVVDTKEAVNIGGHRAYVGYTKGEDGYIHRYFTTDKGEVYTNNGVPIEDSTNYPPLNEEEFRYKVLNNIYGSLNPYYRKNEKGKNVVSEYLTE